MDGLIRTRSWMAVPAALAAFLVCSCSDEPARGEGVPPAEGEVNAVVAERSAVSRLSGTSWQLAEIRRPDHTPIRPDDPAKYVFRFRPDGTLALKLDCNRASGAWTAGPGAEGQGDLKVGPLAMTRARCRPPTLDTRVARDMDYVRSFRMRGARLYLRLSEDSAAPQLSTPGGLYVLERNADSARSGN